MPEMMYREALNQALAEEMARDANVFLIGEEVGRYQGAFKVSQGALERGAVKLRSLFDDVSRELVDRRFFVGERFSAADLTFAALSTPMLFPDEHGSPSLRRADLPDDLGALVDELRATTAGQHAMRMYRDLRGVCVSER